MRESKPIILWPVFVAFRRVTGSQTSCWVVRLPCLPQPLQNRYYPSLNPNHNFWQPILLNTEQKNVHLEVTADVLFLIPVYFGLGPKWTSISQLIYPLGWNLRHCSHFRILTSKCLTAVTTWFIRVASPVYDLNWVLGLLLEKSCFFRVTSCNSNWSTLRKIVKWAIPNSIPKPYQNSIFNFLLSVPFIPIRRVTKDTLYCYINRLINTHSCSV